MTTKQFDQIIEDLVKARARETKNRAVELMQQELIQKIIETHNTSYLATLLNFFEKETGSFVLFRKFLEKALEETLTPEEQQEYIEGNKGILYEDF